MFRGSKRSRDNLPFFVGTFMTFRSPSSSTSRNLILLWASIAIVMALAVMWGATRTHDPLSDFIHTDKMRHIMAFGAIMPIEL